MACEHARITYEMKVVNAGRTRWQVHWLRCQGCEAEVALVVDLTETRAREGRK